MGTNRLAVAVAVAVLFVALCSGRSATASGDKAVPYGDRQPISIPPLGASGSLAWSALSAAPTRRGSVMGVQPRPVFRCFTVTSVGQLMCRLWAASSRTGAPPATRVDWPGLLPDDDERKRQWLAGGAWSALPGKTCGWHLALLQRHTVPGHGLSRGSAVQQQVLLADSGRGAGRQAGSSSGSRCCYGSSSSSSDPATTTATTAVPAPHLLKDWTAVCGHFAWQSVCAEYQFRAGEATQLR